jgi:hypothetical protein
MREPPQWYQLSAVRLAGERATLAGLPYFTLERVYYDLTAKFAGIGTMHFFGGRSRKLHKVRVRLEYPSDFPKRTQRVFDHDEVFKTGANGHLLTSHEMCLTFSERGEFAIGTERLTEEVIGAALVWFHKRLLFERTGTWPGPAERHGIAALLDLLVERRVAGDANAISNWLFQHAASSDGRPQKPDVYAPCPCGSGKPLKFCHHDELRPLFKWLARVPAWYRMKDIIESEDDAAKSGHP